MCVGCIAMAVTFAQVQVMLNAMLQSNPDSMSEILGGIANHRHRHKSENFCKPIQFWGEKSKYNERMVKYLAYAHSKSL